MGNGMNKILEGLYVGNYRDSRDSVQLTKNKITHIISIHDNAKPLHADKKYLCITASDSAEQDLSQYFTECIQFIHTARLNKGAVLVHCLAGVSRSVTITVAYVMSVTELGWRDALNVVRVSRTCASPNFGFQRQLHEFQFNKVSQERERLVAEFGESSFDDKEDCQRLLEMSKAALHAATRLNSQRDHQQAGLPCDQSQGATQTSDSSPYDQSQGATQCSSASSPVLSNHSKAYKSSTDCADMVAALNADLAEEEMSKNRNKRVEEEVKDNTEEVKEESKVKTCKGEAVCSHGGSDDPPSSNISMSPSSGKKSVSSDSSRTRLTTEEHTGFKKS